MVNILTTNIFLYHSTKNSTMKTLKLFVFFALLCSALSGYAQSYSFIKTVSEDIWRIVPAQNGTFYSITWTADCPEDLITISYFNEKGEILNTFQSPPYIGSIISVYGLATNNNHLILYLSDATINHLLYEFDTDGTLIWNNNMQFTNPTIKVNKIVPSPTGYYLLGTTNSMNNKDTGFATITKVSPLGKHQWTKKYGITPTSAASTRFNDMIYHNNSLIAVGRYYYLTPWVGQGQMRPTVSVLDTAGNLLQNYCYVVDSSAFNGFDYYEFMQISKTPNNRFYLIGNNGGNEHALFKMNSAYNIQWIKEKLSGKALAMCEGYNEDVFVAPANGYDNLVLRFDSTGVITGNHITKNPSSGFQLDYGQVVSIKKHDCGFLLINDDAMYAHVPKDFSYCLDSTKTSGIGNYYAVNNFYRRSISLVSSSVGTPNQFVITASYLPITKTAVTHGIVSYTCSNTMANESPIQDNLKVYPNPTKSMLYIELPQAYSHATITLYETTGRVALQQVSNDSGLYALEVGKLSAGVYVLQVQQNERVFTQKVQIME